MTLFDELAAIWNNGAGREAVVAVLKSKRAETINVMRRMLDTTETIGLEAMFAHADALDSMLRGLFVFARETAKVSGRLALVAVGGYGRRELAPFSDVDILFLFDAETPEIREAVALITSLLWDAGLKVGASARTPAECVVDARGDFTVRTNLLESRLICGDDTLFDDFCARYNDLRTENGGADFVEAKMDERARRYRRMGLSKYMLEPNVKEGRGGLRDLHLLFWLAKYLYGVTDMVDWTRSGILSPAACRKFLKAHRFLATVRCHLHLLNNKAGDILTFDAQRKIAEKTGYFDRSGQAAVERFMKRYYLISKTVGELSGQVIVAVTDAIKGENTVQALPETTDFYLTNDRLTFKNHLHFNEDPLVLLRAFVWRQRLQKSLNPRALQLISDNAKLIRRVRGSIEARDLFFEILLSDNPETALRQMTETGVLGCLIPEFQNIVAQVQFDLYHVYTTDEHTLKTIGYLSETPADKTPQSRLALYLGALLHDIGKGLGAALRSLGYPGLEFVAHRQEVPLRRRYPAVRQLQAAELRVEVVQHDLQQGRDVLDVRREGHRDPVDVRIMDERSDIGIVLRAHVYALEMEVQADLLDLVDAVPRGCGHPDAPGALPHVSRDVHVRVVPPSAVGLVVYDQGEAGQVVPPSLQVVGYGLRRGDDDIALLDDPGALGVLHQAVEHGHLRSGEQPLELLVVLLDQRFRGGHEEDLALVQELGRHPDGDDRLAETRRKDQERVGSDALFDHAGLVSSLLDRLEGYARVVDEDHDGLPSA